MPRRCAAGRKRACFACGAVVKQKRALLLQNDVPDIFHVFGDAVVDLQKVVHLIAGVDDGRVVAVAHRLADGNERDVQDLAHEEGADLPRLHELLFLALAQQLRLVQFVKGAHAGDDLIRRFAEELTRFNDPHVFISRNGGDEFLLIAEKKNETEFRRLLTSIDDALRRENDNNPDETAISYAVGSAFGGGSVYMLVHEADCRMYAQKQDQKRDSAFSAPIEAAD